MARRTSCLAAVGLCLLSAVGPSLASAQVAPSAVPLASSQRVGTVAGATDEYVLGPEDVIEIEVVGQPDKARARVYTDGTIQMNLVGKLTAAGKTPRELGNEVAAALKAGGFYANPLVNVEIVSYASRYVTVLGAVGSPSLVPVDRVYRLSEILARVGGAQATAADYVSVNSEGESGTRRYLIKDLATGDEAKDPFVKPGDKIFVPVAEEVYVSGQVNTPGRIAMRTNMTIGQAIATAGGLTASGSEKKVEVTRGGKKMKLKADDLVQPGDVLVVGERLF